MPRAASPIQGKAQSSDYHAGIGVFLASEKSRHSSSSPRMAMLRERDDRSSLADRESERQEQHPDPTRHLDPIPGSISLVPPNEYAGPSSGASWKPARSRITNRALALTNRPWATNHPNAPDTARKKRDGNPLRESRPKNFPTMPANLSEDRAQ